MDEGQGTICGMVMMMPQNSRLDAIVRHAYEIGWTRDPFDRLIVANVQADGAELVTADRKILANFSQAVW